LREELKVYSSNRPTMFLWVDQIYITSEYLTVTSNNCLRSALMHEYGHLKQRRIMFALTVVSLVVFLQLVLLLPVNFLLVWTPCTYLWFCYLCRLGEYHSDEYSLRHTSVSGVTEMLSGEGSRLDTRLSMMFYPFKWHPSTKKRLNNLGL